ETFSVADDVRPAAAASGNPVRRSPSAQITSVQQRRFSQLVAAHRHVRIELDQANEMLVAHPPRGVDGKRRKITETPLFDRRHVRSQLGKRAPRSVNDYIRDRANFTIDPHPLFVAAEYLQRYPDV